MPAERARHTVVGVEGVVLAGRPGQVPRVHEDVGRVEPVDRLVERHLPGVQVGERPPRRAGSSRSPCTASAWCRQAPAGSSSTEGPFTSRMPLPPSRKPGNHSTRCRTTSRARHSSTGEGASHSFVPRVSSANLPATARCRAGGSWGMPVTAPRSRAGGRAPRSRLHSGLHAAGQPAVAGLEGVAQAHRVQPGVPVAEVLEDQRLERHALGHALPGERLDDPVGTDGVEAAPEGRLELRPAGRGVAPRPSVARVPVLDLGADVVRARPSGRTARGRCGPGAAAPGWPRSRGRCGSSGPSRRPRSGTGCSWWS